MDSTPSAQYYSKNEDGRMICVLGVKMDVRKGDYSVRIVKFLAFRNSFRRLKI